jgi:hypothetical protein
MPTNYSGNAANNPTQIQIPSDGDGPGIKAADVNAALEGLMDKSAYLIARAQETVDFVSQIPLNFPVPALTPGGTLVGSGGLWSEVERCWFVYGNTGGVVLRRSSDDGATWGANEYVDAARYIVDATYKLNGRIVAITSDGKILEYTPTASFSLSTITPFGTSPTAMRVFCTPIDGTWVALGHVSGTIAAYTSTAPVTAWTTRTPAIGSGGIGTGMVRAAVRPSDDLIVCVNAAGSAQVTVQTSADQGATWTAQSTINLATVTGLSSSSNTLISLVWDSYFSRFVLAVSKNGGVGAITTDIYTSADGVAWTLRKSFAALACVAIAPFGLSPLAPRLAAMVITPNGIGGVQTPPMAAPPGGTPNSTSRPRRPWRSSRPPPAPPGNSFSLSPPPRPGPAFAADSLAPPHPERTI